MTAAILIVTLIALVGGVAISVLFLYGGMALYNVVDPAKPIPYPTFARAGGIILASGLINAILNFIVKASVSGAYGAPVGHEIKPLLVTLAITLIIDTLVMGCMICFIVPAEFGRSLGASICFHWIIIGLLIFAGIMLGVSRILRHAHTALPVRQIQPDPADKTDDTSDSK